MTRYLLDNTIVSDLVRNPQGRAAGHIQRVGEAQVCTSIIVAAGSPIDRNDLLIAAQTLALG